MRRRKQIRRVPGMDAPLTALHAASMRRYFAASDPQAAAEYICRQHGIEVQNAMDAAAQAGFMPEYYGDSIRVHLPGSKS